MLLRVATLPPFAVAASSDIFPTSGVAPVAEAPSLTSTGFRLNAVDPFAVPGVPLAPASPPTVEVPGSGGKPFEDVVFCAAALPSFAAGVALAGGAAAVPPSPGSGGRTLSLFVGGSSVFTSGSVDPDMVDCAIDVNILFPHDAREGSRRMGVK